MILMIDNYDSFTFNIVQYLGELGALVKVIRNDELTTLEIEHLSPEKIILSPGPCTPNEAGICIETIERYGGIIPIFGVCLGCQCIGQAMGGKIIKANQVMHGKISAIYHHKKGVFANINSPFKATRYHSLVIDRNGFPESLEVTAWTQTEKGEFDEIMAVKHKTKAIEGVQFHPESILSEYGKEILKNFISQ